MLPQHNREIKKVFRLQKGHVRSSSVAGRRSQREDPGQSSRPRQGADAATRQTGQEAP